MRIYRLINFACILLGGGIVLYAQAGAQQNEYILIGGIALLMIGIYRLSRGIPDQCNTHTDSNTINTEDGNAY